MALSFQLCDFASPEDESIKSYAEWKLTTLLWPLSSVASLKQSASLSIR